MFESDFQSSHLSAPSSASRKSLSIDGAQLLRTRGYAHAFVSHNTCVQLPCQHGTPPMFRDLEEHLMTTLAMPRDHVYFFRTQHVQLLLRQPQHCCCFSVHYTMHMDSLPLSLLRNGVSCCAHSKALDSSGAQAGCGSPKSCTRVGTFIA